MKFFNSNKTKEEVELVTYSHPIPTGFNFYQRNRQVLNSITVVGIAFIVLSLMFSGNTFSHIFNNAKADSFLSTCPDKGVFTDHYGSDVIISSNTTWSGIHCNIGELIVNKGVELYLVGGTNEYGKKINSYEQIFAKKVTINGSVLHIEDFDGKLTKI